MVWACPVDVNGPSQEGSSVRTLMVRFRCRAIWKRFHCFKPKVGGANLNKNHPKLYRFQCKTQGYTLAPPLSPSSVVNNSTFTSVLHITKRGRGFLTGDHPIQTFFCTFSRTTRFDDASKTEANPTARSCDLRSSSLLDRWKSCRWRSEQEVEVSQEQRGE